jgi:Na+/H+-dicarboxylate symporter
MAIILGIDRIPDMFRSATNNLGQLTTSVLVDAWVDGPALDRAAEEAVERVGGPALG